MNAPLSTAAPLPTTGRGPRLRPDATRRPARPFRRCRRAARGGGHRGRRQGGGAVRPRAALAARAGGGPARRAVYENGVVRVPPTYRDAYRGWVEGGWQGLPASAQHSGQGLPQSLWMAVQELVCAADMAFSLLPLLTAGAIEALWSASPAGAGSRHGCRGWSPASGPAPCASPSRRRAATPFAGPHPRRAGGKRHLPTAPARRSTSPGASTTWRRTRCTSCSRGCRTRRRGRAASCRLRGAEGAVERAAQRAPLRRHRAQARHPCLAHLRDAVRRRRGGADRRGEPRPPLPCSP